MRSFQFYLVSTPIGNLEDISARAKDTLASVDLVLAEDTRKAGVLLKRHGISAKTRAYHDHNKEKVTPGIIEELKKGLRMALITDGGTPVISDPGFYIVRELIRNEIEFTAIPGPAAFAQALVLSGLPPDRFTFYGYPPKKSGKREKLMEEAGGRRETSIFYESPFRLIKTLKSIDKVLGSREVVVARELTKLHEEVRRGTAAGLIEYFEERGVKGEITLLIKGEGNKKRDGTS